MRRKGDVYRDKNGVKRSASEVAAFPGDGVIVGSLFDLQLRATVSAGLGTVSHCKPGYMFR